MSEQSENNPKAEESKEEISHQVERYKALLDYSKHLTTLSTGSIVLVAGFVEKAFPNGHWKSLTAVSLIAFMVSILGALVAHTVFIFEFPPQSVKEEEWVKTLGAVSLLAAWGGFLIGILSIAIFATRNLL